MVRVIDRQEEIKEKKDKYHQFYQQAVKIFGQDRVQGPEKSYSLDSIGIVTDKNGDPDVHDVYVDLNFKRVDVHKQEDLESALKLATIGEAIFGVEFTLEKDFRNKPQKK